MKRNGKPTYLTAKSPMQMIEVALTKLDSMEMPRVAKAEPLVALQINAMEKMTDFESQLEI